jgi:hypothetical protein
MASTGASRAIFRLEADRRKALPDSRASKVGAPAYAPQATPEPGYGR